MQLVSGRNRGTAHYLCESFVENGLARSFHSLSGEFLSLALGHRYQKVSLARVDCQRAQPSAGAARSGAARARLVGTAASAGAASRMARTL